MKLRNVVILSLSVLVVAASVVPAAPFSVVYSFGPNDGSQVQGDMTLDGTTLFGVANRGGNPADSITLSGTVFKVDVLGNGFEVLHSFENYHSGRFDGASPQGGLRVNASTVSGVARVGGWEEGGTYFRVGRDGTGFTTTSHFSSTGVSSFGWAVNGDLNYGTGTASHGGDNGNGVLLGAGFSAFSMPGGSGALKRPVGANVFAGGALYGMAYEGGAFGRGGLFKVFTDGTGYEVLHSFSGGADGGSPSSTLKIIDSKIYGTTASTIFSMNLDGSDYQVLHSGAGGSNILQVGARLYGAWSDKVWEIGLDGNNFNALVESTGNDGFLARGGLTFVDHGAAGTWLYGLSSEQPLGDIIVCRAV